MIVLFAVKTVDEVAVSSEELMKEVQISGHELVAKMETTKSEVCKLCEF